MIHLHLSKIFADDLHKAGCNTQAPATKDSTWHWYAHRVTLLRRKCIIVMEEESRYALIFVGLKKPDLAQFGKVLASRIVAEASGLCDLPHPGPNEQLIDKLTRTCTPLGFSQGLNRSLQAHIKHVALEMELIVRHRVGRLPENAKEEFALGLMLNDTLRKHSKEKDYFVPVKRWRENLLRMLEPRDTSNLICLADFRKKSQP